MSSQAVAGRERSRTVVGDAHNPSSLSPPPCKRTRRSVDGEGMPVMGASNGVAGAPPPLEYVGPSGMLNRTELVRLLQQGLYDLGYHSSARHLEQESGVQLQSELVVQFRDKVLAGGWDDVRSLLRQLRLDDAVAETTAIALVICQQMMEALEAGQVAEALALLRSELTPRATLTTTTTTAAPAAAAAGGEKGGGPARKVTRRDTGANGPTYGGNGGDSGLVGWRHPHRLAALFVCSDAAELREKAQWAGSGAEGRVALLRELQALLPPSLLLPEARLQVLLVQALEAQRSACRVHNTDRWQMSLLHNHQCEGQIPTHTHQILDEHTDEVWHVAWSPDGEHLAAASRDQTVRVWAVSAPAAACTIAHTLRGHTAAVQFVAWSPDSQLLLSCGDDAKVMLWEVSTGTLKHTISKHAAAVTACAWLPDSQRFVTGGHDRHMYMWDVSGNELRQWHGGRINDLVVSADGKRMVSAHSEVGDTRMQLYELDGDDETQLVETAPVTSLALGRDGRSLLVVLQSQTIHLWDLAAPAPPPSQPQPPRSRGAPPPPTSTMQQVMEYRHSATHDKQSRYVIRACLGGSDESFVVSGAEDSQVYIWHVRTGELLHVLPGHSGSVNAVAWNHANPYLFASASDDRTVRVWGLASDHDHDHLSGCGGHNHHGPPAPLAQQSSVTQQHSPSAANPPAAAAAATARSR